MKKVIIAVMIASGLIVAMDTRPIVSPRVDQWPYIFKRRPIILPYFPDVQSLLFQQLSKLGVDVDAIRKKAAQHKLVLARQNKAQTINTITMYVGLQRGIAKLKKKITRAKRQLRTWGWVLPPKIKSNIKNDLEWAKRFEPKLHKSLNLLEKQHPGLKTLKL